MKDFLIIECVHFIFHYLVHHFCHLHCKRDDTNQHLHSHKSIHNLTQKLELKDITASLMQNEETISAGQE